jgi:hypothetical protein
MGQLKHMDHTFGHFKVLLTIAGTHATALTLADYNQIANIAALLIGVLIAQTFL